MTIHGNATLDSGCEPNILMLAQAEASHNYYCPLKEEQQHLQQHWSGH